jgi:hypothetical protein
MDIEEVAEHTPHLIFVRKLILCRIARFSSKKNSLNLGLLEMLSKKW